MIKKKSMNILLLIIGLILIACSFLFRDEALKVYQGICIGVGCGLFGMSGAQLYMLHLAVKQPELMRQSEIEEKDERSIIIRNKAKAKAGDITQWFIIGIAYITILVDAPLWVTLLTVGVFVLYTVLGLVFINRYQKEM